MHRSRPVTTISRVAVPGIRTGLRVFLFLIGALLLSFVVLAAPGAKPADKQVKQPAPSDFVGSETCATCHEDVSKKFADNPHTKMAMMHGKSGITCENCHGAGKAHVDGGGDTSKIVNPGKLSAKELDARCLSCHGGQHANFDRSAHAKANVSCISCHSIHESEEKAELLKTSQPNLCFQCHSDQKAQFSRAFHHKVEEGLIKCTDCHDSHGTTGRSALKSSAQQDAVCTKCHTETAGPYVYEHAVVKTEGCTSCHSPHGTPNPRMLNTANVNTLCLQCHSPSPNFSTGLPIGPAHNQNQQYQACTICHTSVHGSNTSPVFFNSTE